MLAVFDDGRQTRLVTEEADGGELFDLVSNSGPVAEEKAACFAWQLLSAIAFLHSHRIGHRDISLENVLLCGGEVRLMDFGQCVRSHHGDTQMRYFRPAGKDMYRAPECYVPTRISGRVDVRVPYGSENLNAGMLFMKLDYSNHLCEVKIPADATPGSRCSAELMGYAVAPADMFSCGVTLFVMVLGQPPWRRASLTDVLFAQLHKLGNDGLPNYIKTVLRKDLPSHDLLTLLIDMLQADPSKRPAAEDCLGSSWVQNGFQYEKHMESDISTTCDNSESSELMSSHLSDVEDINNVHNEIAKPCIYAHLPSVGTWLTHVRRVISQDLCAAQ